MIGPAQRTLTELIGPLNEVEGKHAPDPLFVSGDLSLLQRGSRVSVVGSRRVAPEALQRARAITKILVEHDAVVVSGLAEGVDAVAHETTIRLGGRTIAVLGTPLDQCYPKENRALLDQIQREHLAVSQFAPGSPIHRSNFPMRNRTMALLSETTVIVEAAAKSGTEHQAWEALRLGRLVFVMESLAKRGDVAWVQEILQYGAQVLSRDNLPEFLENLPSRVRDDAIPF